MKNFTIFKVTEKKHEKAPDYSISTKVDDKYITIGGCWLKEGKSGKFFSCKLSDTYQDRAGFSLVKDLSVTTDEIMKESIKVGEAVKNDITPEEIPF